MSKLEPLTEKKVKHLCYGANDDYFIKEEVHSSVLLFGFEIEKELSVMDIEQEYKNAFRRALLRVKDKAFPIFREKKR